MRLWVAALASACVVGGALTVKRPPPAKKPWPELTTVGLGSQVLHHAGLPESAHVIAGFCSVWSCGGRLLIAKLLGVTSYAIPAPPRMAHLPWPVGSYANPRRGAKLLISGLGARKKRPSAGSSEIPLMDCGFSA